MTHLLPPPIVCTVIVATSAQLTDPSHLLKHASCPVGDKPDVSCACVNVLGVAHVLRLKDTRMVAISLEHRFQRGVDGGVRRLRVRVLALLQPLGRNLGGHQLHVLAQAAEVRLHCHLPQSLVHVAGDAEELLTDANALLRWGAGCRQEDAEARKVRLRVVAGATSDALASLAQHTQEARPVGHRLVAFGGPQHLVDQRLLGHVAHITELLFIDGCQLQLGLTVVQHRGAPTNFDRPNRLRLDSGDHPVVHALDGALQLHHSLGGALVPHALVVQAR
ncbi:hypothetical protein I4F81_010678 [Pyropia yezoensis]|uniref:Uncharacterized protein n=1 Tax=Pyropia yezoensis TaxID=2788 RepID=A0ACC3CDD6_PYRYE|nr:hypothetical protein I4F81_010678 [Neopyropia yezoensis]